MGVGVDRQLGKVDRRSQKVDPERFKWNEVKEQF